MTLRRIDKIESKTFNGEVYNLEVEKDHSYIANGVAVHNCFVIPVDDSLNSIFEAVKTTAIIQQAGGGTGFTFTHLRPKGDMVQSTKGIASGPVSFIKVFDTTTDVIKQGSKRRGANMGILNVNHPDIVEFITSKAKEDAFTNFNFSVGVTDDFMKAVRKNRDYSLINPRTKQEIGKLNAAELFDMICMYAWRTGDPGLIFFDQINKKNPLLKGLGKIEATNPCGEAPLYPYESCNLGSINLAKFVKDKKIDWDKLKETVRISTRFLDDVIDANKYPVKEIEKVSKDNRRIGLGVMGFAEMLIQLGIPYDSKDAIKTAGKLMKFINNEAVKVSEELAKEKGEFPNISKSSLKRRRNVAVTTIAPTGTISIIAGCSSGIEPLFAVTFVRNVMGGTRLVEINPYFEKIAKERGFYSESLMSSIARTGSIQKLEEVPEDVKKVFRTALDIEPEWHVRIQAAFQEYTENAVSKTINFPHEATVEDVKKAYLLAYKLGCK
ncbi:MAG: adenosylcobalamin-dependent ribonucleoside-diphosphate reductase, partial [Nanoarchaeota archaeon]|nr:adenosylcobalamin-dependent ribonucleoside-diphosphate reductase [Nanoarchaeota archaeon]